MPYDPESSCSTEAAIRRQIAIANYGGNWRHAKELYVTLNDHHKTCPVCNGEIYGQLFKSKVVIAK